MSNMIELIARSNLSDSKILKIKFLKETQLLVLLKASQNSEVFIEIIDIINDTLKKVILKEKISPFEIIHFHPIDECNFYFNVKHKGKYDTHLKVNDEGVIVLESQFDIDIYSLNYKHILRKFIFREDMKLLNLEDFQEFNLYDFLNDNLDDELDFCYLYSEGRHRYEIFSMPDDNILGFEVFDKDGDEPRFIFLILEIISPSKINILFVGKIEDCGYKHTLRNDLKEIVYRSCYYSNDTIKIRELTNNEFKYFEELNIITNKINYNNEENIIYFDDDKILIQYLIENDKYDKILFYNRKNSILTETIYTDKFLSYHIVNKMLFFVKDSKLNYVEI